MDQSSALTKLLETADLLRMVEDLFAPGTLEKLSPATLSGMRVTLRNVREGILAGHDSLAKSLVSRAQVSIENAQTAQAQVTSTEARRDLTSNAFVPRSEINRSTVIAESDRLQIKRRDLRSSLDTIIER